VKSDFYKKFDGTPAIVIGVVAVAALAYGAYYTYNSMEAEKARLLTELSAAQDWNYELLIDVRERGEIIESFQGQIENIGSTVGTLQKLANTDEELLMKYSKIYFLNENYIPARLAEIDKLYLNKAATNIQIHSDVWPYLERLIEDAHASGIELLVASAYRSFDTQSSLKSTYTVTYGSGANRFSADQGYSEHQLGTAVDFTTEKLGSNFSAFGSDSAYKWLQENAHRYGFILSYPPNNSYYKYEPWHWRYVGVSLATHLHDDGKYFYDLDQREIDKYLVKLFD